jgi:hypothetical protein
MAITNPAAYANLALVKKPAPSASHRSAAQRKSAAAGGREEEARLKAKVEQANSILDWLEIRAEAQGLAMKALAKRKAATLARIARIEDAILTKMDEAGLKVVTGLRCSMRSQPAPESLEVLDESLIPREYMRDPKRPPASPDKVALKNAFAANDELVPKDWGCKLTSKISLLRR